VLSQLILEDLETQHFKGYAKKLEIPEVRLACSECHVLVSKESMSCRHCGALFVEV
jgi:hypothetical protein